MKGMRNRTILVAIILHLVIFIGSSFTQDSEQIARWGRDNNIPLTYKEVNDDSYKTDTPSDTDSIAYINSNRELIKLSIRKKNLGKVNLTDFAKLEILDLSGCGLDNFSIPQIPPSITDLYLKHNEKLTRVALNSFTNLKRLDIARCGFSDLSISTFPPTLIYLNLRDNTSLKTVEIKGLANLEELDLSFCKLSQLLLSNMANLTFIRLQYSKVDNATISGLTKIQTLDFWDCDLLNLTLTELPSLSDLLLSDNYRLSRIDAGSISTLLRLNFTQDDCDLKEVWLHPLNKAFPNITRIVYGRDKEKRITSIEYFAQNGAYVNYLSDEDSEGVAFAKKTINYSSKGKEVKTFTAEELNK